MSCQFNDPYNSHLPQAMNIRSEMSTLARLQQFDLRLWQHQIKTVIILYGNSLRTGRSHVIEAVALSCLEIIKGQIICGKPGGQKYERKIAQEIGAFIVDQESTTLNLSKRLRGEEGHRYTYWLHILKGHQAEALSPRGGSAMTDLFVNFPIVMNKLYFPSF